MSHMTISAQVLDGHLHHERLLTELEGRHVVAELTVMPDVSQIEPAAPPELELQRDLYFPIATPSIPLGKVTVHAAEGKPRIILAEELPD